MTRMVQPMEVIYTRPYSQENMLRYFALIVIMFIRPIDGIIVSSSLFQHILHSLQVVFSLDLSINQISIAPISPAKPGSVARQSNH